MPRFKVNTNGTPPDNLVQQSINVMEAVRTAERTMRNAQPHGRDYQTAENGHMAHALDTEEYVEMLKKLREVYEWAEKRGLEAQKQRESGVFRGTENA